MRRLTYNPDTRIAQSLVTDDRPTKGQLEATLQYQRSMKRVDCDKSKNTAHDLAIDLRDLAIAHLSSEIVCRQIEDVEIELIALQQQLEIEHEDNLYPRAIRRIQLYILDDEYALEQLHAKLAYHLRERARFQIRVMA